MKEESIDSAMDFSFSALQSPSAFPSYLSGEEESEEENSQIASLSLYRTEGIDDDDGHDLTPLLNLARQEDSWTETLNISSHDCEDLSLKGDSVNRDAEVEILNLNQIDECPAGDRKGKEDTYKEAQTIIHCCRRKQSKILNHGCSGNPNKYEHSCEEIRTSIHECVEKPKLYNISWDETQSPCSEKYICRDNNESSQNANTNSVSKDRLLRVLKQREAWRMTHYEEGETLSPWGSPNNGHRSKVEEKSPSLLVDSQSSSIHLSLTATEKSPPCTIIRAAQGKGNDDGKFRSQEERIKVKDSKLSSLLLSPAAAAAVGGGGCLVRRTSGREEEGWLCPREVKKRSSLFFSRSTPSSSCRRQRLLDNWIVKY